MTGSDRESIKPELQPDTSVHRFGNILGILRRAHQPEQLIEPLAVDTVEPANSFEAKAEGYDPSAPNSWDPPERDAHILNT